MKARIVITNALLAVVLSVCAQAKEIEAQPIAFEQFSGSSIGFSSKMALKNTTLKISGPSDFYVYKAAEHGMPSIDLHQRGGLKDGLYQYEITTSAGPLVLVKDNINNGRGDNNQHYAAKGVTQSGHFRVVGGQIKRYRQLKEPVSAAW